ncbi:MAG: Dabb family protein [Clostridia bacterium]|nr:Dabb family protein [Clostridia bacterium]
MINHIIIWNLDKNLSAEEKQKVKSEAKEKLEGLYGKIDGLTKIKVEINPLESSNADMLLFTQFTDGEALKAYQESPLHNAVADKYVRPYAVSRACLDYICEE